jgi:hypothetical protein
MQPDKILEALILLMLANGTPLLAKKVLGDRLSYPVDANLRFADGKPLFGPSKTVRGVILAVLTTAAGAALLRIDWRVGVLLGSAAMAGDLFSSFIKRRCNMSTSSMALGLDQVPESLFPLIACEGWLSLGLVDISVTVALFFAGEIVLSRFFFALGLRDRPY